MLDKFIELSKKFPYQFKWSQTLPHIAWADIYNNGVLTEIVVMNIDTRTLDLYFFPTSVLDNIDTYRLINILKKRDSDKYALWDLMSMNTLQNAMNALEYFHQYVKVRTVGGQIYTPTPGKVGATLGKKFTLTELATGEAQKVVEADVSTPQVAKEADQQSVSEKRGGPKRPPSVD